MAHNRTVSYSAPFRRNNLLGLHQYAASENFPSLGTWDRAQNDDLYVVRGTLGRTHPVSITVVGAITSDRANLEPHGNYNPSWVSLEELPKKARLQFYISCPSDDPDFSADWALAMKRLKAIQEEIAASPTGRREHFIQGPSMKMNFLLFEKKEAEADVTTAVEKENSGPDGARTSETDEDEEARLPDPVPRPPVYEVASPYRDAWETASQTHHNNIMQVFGVDELPVDYRKFHKVLASGTTVVVTFILKHYAFKDKTTSQVAADTYTALVQSVSILKEAEKKRRPSFTPKRRPVPVSQLPTRSTLKFAADTFAPVHTPKATTSPSSSKVSARNDDNIPPSLQHIKSPTSPLAFSRKIEGGSPVLADISANVATSSDVTIDMFSQMLPPTNVAAASSLTPDVFSQMLPHFLQEVRNPSSRLFNPTIVAALGRSPSPGGSPSSTLSTLSDRPCTPEIRDASSWVEVAPSNGSTGVSLDGPNEHPSRPSPGSEPETAETGPLEDDQGIDDIAGKELDGDPEMSLKVAKKAGKKRRL